MEGMIEMVLFVSNSEEERAIRNMFNTIEKIYFYVEKDYPIEDIYEETLDLHEIISEFPELFKNNVWVV